MYIIVSGCVLVPTAVWLIKNLLSDSVVSVNRTLSSVGVACNAAPSHSRRCLGLEGGVEGQEAVAVAAIDELHCCRDGEQ